MFLHSTAGKGRDVTFAATAITAPAFVFVLLQTIQSALQPNLELGVLLVFLMGIIDIAMAFVAITLVNGLHQNKRSAAILSVPFFVLVSLLDASLLSEVSNNHLAVLGDILGVALMACTTTFFVRNARRVWKLSKIPA